LPCLTSALQIIDTCVQSLKEIFLNFDYPLKRINSFSQFDYLLRGIVIFHIFDINRYKHGFKENISVEEYIGNEGELEKIVENIEIEHCCTRICGLFYSS